MGRNRLIDKPWRRSLASAQETFALGEAFSSYLKPNAILALSGDLGAGKTTFVQGLAVGLGIEDTVVSPTFIYLNIYDSPSIPLFHFDLYRLKSHEDFMKLGFAEYFDEGGICAIEWPERINLPSQAIHLEFIQQSSSRIVQLAGGDPNLLYSLAPLWD